MMMLWGRILLIILLRSTKYKIKVGMMVWGRRLIIYEVYYLYDVIIFICCKIVCDSKLL